MAEPTSPHQIRASLKPIQITKADSNPPLTHHRDQSPVTGRLPTLIFRVGSNPTLRLLAKYKKRFCVCFKA